ncbi:MAG: hypothetical protein ACTHPS_17145 [Streptosporangiaceae bacterium]
MRRFGVIVALGALLGMFGGVATASPALAGRGPKWEIADFEPFTLPAAVCGFEVRVTAVVNKVFVKVLKASDGSMTFLFNGSLHDSYTNLQTGKAITENIPGQAKATEHPDGSLTFSGHGHNELFLTPADAKRFGLPTASVVVGALTISFTASGDITSLSLHGHVLVDVCAALS